MSEKLGIQKTPVFLGIDMGFIGIYRDLWGIIEISRNLRDFTRAKHVDLNIARRDLITKVYELNQQEYARFF